MKRLTSTPLQALRGMQLLALVLLLALGLTACQNMETEVQPAEPIEEVEPAPTPATTIEEDMIDELDLESAPAIASDPPPSPAPPILQDRCPPSCEITVTLPADIGSPPSISKAMLRARSGASVTVNLVDEANRPGSSATILRFQEAAFVNRGGQPMETVPLTPGRNVFTVRDYADGECREAEGGCKYDVINTGEPGRPVLDPHVIIWQ